MLVLTMKKEDRIDIGDATLIFLGYKSEDSIRVGFEAPRSIDIVRQTAKRKERKTDDNSKC